MQSLAQRLLVVEDDVTLARALSRTLARCGFSVAVARSCTAARSLAQTFDMAILDLDLPDGNGVDLARQLLDSGKVPGVMFFTGSTDPGMLARARRLGPLVMKAKGSGELITLLATSESADPPESRTNRSSKLDSVRAPSLRRSRAR